MITENSPKQKDVFGEISAKLFSLKNSFDQNLFININLYLKYIIFNNFIKMKKLFKPMKKEKQ